MPFSLTHLLKHGRIASGNGAYVCSRKGILSEIHLINLVVHYIFHSFHQANEKQQQQKTHKKWITTINWSTWKCTIECFEKCPNKFCSWIEIGWVSDVQPDRVGPYRVKDAHGPIDAGRTASNQTVYHHRLMVQQTPPKWKRTKTQRRKRCSIHDERKKKKKKLIKLLVWSNDFGRLNKDNNNFTFYLSCCEIGIVTSQLKPILTFG